VADSKTGDFLHSFAMVCAILPNHLASTAQRRTEDSALRASLNRCDQLIPMKSWPSCTLY